MVSSRGPIRDQVVPDTRLGRSLRGSGSDFLHVVRRKDLYDRARSSPRASLRITTALTGEDGGRVESRLPLDLCKRSVVPRSRKRREEYCIIKDMISNVKSSTASGALDS